MNASRKSRLSAAPDEPTDVLLGLEGLDCARTLGRYDLLWPVGRGGMGVVWAARLRGSRGFTRIVALKTMRGGLHNDKTSDQAFLIEAQIASRIRHPNVCQILDVGEHRGLLYLVMEWVDGDSLSTLMKLALARGERIPYGVAAWIAAKAARGLQAAHELCDEHGQSYGVVHRDVSPHNILATPDGDVRVVDFGVARVALETMPVTRSGYLKGKVAYLAPEQVRGDEFDARADIFALGIVLFELSTGEHPFRGSTDLSTVLRIGDPEAAACPSPPDFPSDLRSVLAAALEKEQSRRYPTMRELASDLERCAARDAVSEDAAAAFLARLLAARRHARGQRLIAAIRKADERPHILHRAFSFAARVRTGPAVHRSNPSPEMTPVTVAAPSRRRRFERLTVATAVALAGGLAVLGATERVAHAPPVREAARDSASLPAPVVAARTETGRESEAQGRATPPPAGAVPIAPRPQPRAKRVAPSPSATRGANPPDMRDLPHGAPAASASSDVPAEPSVGRTRFREPGF